MSDKLDTKNGQRKFKYENLENVDSVFNYLATINKGLKSRHLTFGTDEDMIEISLPDNVQLEIKAKNKDDRGSLNIEIKWDQHGESTSKDDTKDKAKSTKATAPASGKTPKQEKKSDEARKQDKKKKTKQQSGKSPGTRKSSQHKAG